MQRRHILSQFSIGVAGAALAACSGGEAEESRTPTFVFVHGAWHGAWCWAEVMRRLALRGYPSIALDMPGHGTEARFPVSYFGAPQDLAALTTEASPLAALRQQDCRDKVIGAIQGLMSTGSGPVILVGHSAGGMTVSAVGEAIPTQIRKLVYLSAFVPVRYPNLLGYLAEPAMASQTAGAFLGDPSALGALRINFRSTDPAYVA